MALKTLEGEGLVVMVTKVTVFVRAWMCVRIRAWEHYMRGVLYTLLFCAKNLVLKG